MKCKFNNCLSELELCKANEPWHSDYFICTKCDSTFNVDEFSEEEKTSCDKCGQYDNENCLCTSPKTLTCPFCNRDKVSIMTRGKVYKCIFCQDCLATGPCVNFVGLEENIIVEKCIEKWNERRFK